MSSRQSEPVRIYASPRVRVSKAGEAAGPRATFPARRSDCLLTENGGVLRDVHRECSFTHRGAGGNDDQIGTLQSAGNLVEIGVMRGESRNPLAAL